MGELIHERRQPDRPKDGDLRVCPVCRHAMQFAEHFVIATGPQALGPAWTCRCGYEQFVRHTAATASVDARPSHPAVRLQELRQLRQALAELRDRSRKPRTSGESMRQRTLDMVARHAPLSRIGLLAADDRGRHLAVNPATCALTGYAESELLDMNVRDLWARQARALDVQWREFLDEGRFEGACHLRRKSSDIIRVRCVGVASVLTGLHLGAMASAGLFRNLGDQPLDTLH